MKLKYLTDMIELLKRLQENRRILLSQTEYLTAEQYNLIPLGFNNNIIWNMGHLLVTGDGILYRNSPDKRPEYEFPESRYGMGSKPGDFLSETEINYIRQSLSETVSLYRIATGMDQPIANSGSTTTATVPSSGGHDLQFLFFHEDMHYRKIAKLLQKVTG